MELAVDNLIKIKPASPVRVGALLIAILGAGQ
jgi:hypothetical protein